MVPEAFRSRHALEQELMQLRQQLDLQAASASRNVNTGMTRSSSRSEGTEGYNPGAVSLMQPRDLLGPVSSQAAPGQFLENRNEMALLLAQEILQRYYPQHRQEAAAGTAAGGRDGSGGHMGGTGAPSQLLGDVVAGVVDEDSTRSSINTTSVRPFEFYGSGTSSDAPPAAPGGRAAAVTQMVFHGPRAAPHAGLEPFPVLPHQDITLLLDFIRGSLGGNGVEQSQVLPPRGQHTYHPPPEPRS
ncbi:unnamed protein product [Amoebophrya sp. A120]|nr:unnamed protein product [Amoebophrya sp. A120]|eukprot:GSA120T00005620001.1